MYIIGIAGASGSGKTLLCQTLIKELQQELGVTQIGTIKEDRYYRDLSHLTMDERVTQNYDHPKAFEHDLFVDHLKALGEGKSIELPVYSYTDHTRLPETETFHPPTILILEGILMLHDKKLRKKMDLKVFVNTPLDISFIRRLKRDVAERGRTVDSVVSQYYQTARPMYYRYVRPSQEHANLIVPHGGRNRHAIDLLKSYIREQFAEQNHPEKIRS